jgi:hypothetical protein
MAAEAVQHTGRDVEPLSAIEEWISQIDGTVDPRGAQMVRRLGTAHEQMSLRIAELEREVEQLRFGQIGTEWPPGDWSAPLRDHPSCPCPIGSTCASLCCPQRNVGG